MRSPRGWSWVLAVPLAFVAAMVVVRFAYVRNDFRREFGDDLISPMRVAQVDIEGWRDNLRYRAQTAVSLLDANPSAQVSALASDSATRIWVEPRSQRKEFTTVSCATGYCVQVRKKLGSGGGTLALEVPVNDMTFRRLDSQVRMRSSRATLVMKRGDSLIVLATSARDTVPFSSRVLSFSAAPAHVKRAFVSNAVRSGSAARGLLHERVVYATVRYPEMDWVLVREVHGDEIVERLLGPLAIEVLLVSALLLFAFAYTKSRVRVAGMRRQQELTELRADFVAAASHELRTPLAQIKLFAELLRNGSMRKPEERDRALNVIAKEAGRLSILVDNVLNHARLRRARRQPLHVEASSVSDVARDVAYVLEAFAPLAAEKDVTVIPAVVKSPMAAVDSQALRQILVNFLENAVKYGPRGQTVTIGSSELADRVRVWVSDEGPGVSEIEVPRIWEPFERGSAAQRSKAVGSGIGLSVVRDLVDQYGSSAWVESSPSGGACFVVEFFKASPHKTLVVASSPTPGPKSASRVSLGSLRKRG